jgi:NAD(P)-dependent dehydrogenase (short-subunit alcohol dehydrogenase family)
MDIGRLFSLQGKTAIVTGGSRGIGFALSEGLADAGATVVAVARSDRPDKPFRTGATQYRVADVTKGLAELFAAVSAEYGGLDVLVNAAGITLPMAGNVGELDRAFERTVHVNLCAAYSSCVAARPFMKSGGSIINVTSIASVRGFPNNPGYVASKGGLRMMTKALAIDYGAAGIRVNALAPGYIETSMTRASFEDERLHEQRRCHTCLGRWGSADDLVGAAIFLASEASCYVTGQDLFVDGGWIAKGLV